MLKHLKSHWLMFFGMLIFVLIVAFPIVTYPMGRDQGMYANIGRTLLNGGVPFVDMWDIKPPPIYYIYAAGIKLFGVNTGAIRAIDLFLVPFGMIGLYLTGNEMKNRRAGFFAALLYAVFYFNDGFQNLSQSDSLATIPTIWLAYFTYKASRYESGSRSALVSSLIVGLISGILLWFKPQQYALVVGAFVVYQILTSLLKSPFPLRREGNFDTTEQSRTHRSLSLRKLFFEGMAFAIGGLIMGGTLLAYFWSQGIIQEILIVAEGTAAYNAQGYDVFAFMANMRQGFYYRWVIWHLLIILTGLWIVGYVIAVFFRRGRATSRPYVSSLLILWFISGLGFAFMQAKGFDTHWFPMLPPMALMGAMVVERFLSFIRDGENGRRKLMIALNVLIMIGLLSIPAVTIWGKSWRYISGQQSQYEYWDTFQANDLKPEQSLEMANFLRERVQPGNSLFIWGFRPEVYYMAELWSASRYQAHFPLVAPWYPHEWQQENVDILWAAMPPYVLVLEDDYMSWVTDFDADSHTLLQDYTELNNWLIANYEREGQIGDFIIWRRFSP